MIIDVTRSVSKKGGTQATVQDQQNPSKLLKNTRANASETAYSVVNPKQNAGGSHEKLVVVRAIHETNVL